MGGAGSVSQLAGSPKVKEREKVDIMWNLTLKGLSLVATSPSQSPAEIVPKQASAGQLTWVLAQLRTDLSIE